MEKVERNNLLKQAKEIANNLPDMVNKASTEIVNIAVKIDRTAKLDGNDKKSTVPMEKNTVVLMNNINSLKRILNKLSEE